MRSHEQIEELMAVRALGGLDPEDDRTLRHEMSDHGPECTECRRLETEYAEVAGRLAFALDPLPVRAGLEDEALARAREGAPAHPSAEPGPRPGSGTGRRLRPLVAIAASLVLFVAGWAAGSLVGGDGADDGGARRVAAFEGETGGSLSVAYRPGEDGVYLLGYGLDAPPEGKVYEVWMFQEGVPVPATCFTPSADGTFFSFVDAELGTTNAMAVTVEPTSCPSAPTSAPVLTATITA
ncbi:MAG: anti-sigma factor domain-containing protein [Actinomycetota bacterium]